MVKKLIGVLLIMMLVLGLMAGAVSAMSSESLKGHDASPAFSVGSHGNQRVHFGNGPVFNQPGNVMCIPTSKAGENSPRLRVANAFDNMSVLKLDK